MKITEEAFVEVEINLEREEKEALSDEKKEVEDLKQNDEKKVSKKKPKKKKKKKKKRAKNKFSVVNFDIIFLFLLIPSLEPIFRNGGGTRLRQRRPRQPTKRNQLRLRIPHRRRSNKERNCRHDRLRRRP